jgi:hypothetical protein
VPAIDVDQLFDQTLGLAEEAAAEEHGDEVLDLASGGEIWREEPVDFETFCYSPGPPQGCRRSSRASSPPSTR